MLVCVQSSLFQSCVLCPGTRPSSVAPGRKPREVEWRYAPASMEAAGLGPAARLPNLNPCRLRYARASRARPEIPPHIPDHPIPHPSSSSTVHTPRPLRTTSTQPIPRPLPQLHNSRFENVVCLVGKEILLFLDENTPLRRCLFAIGLNGPR